MSKFEFQPGQAISFLYPRYNFHGIKSKLYLRRARIKYVRDTRAFPIEQMAIEENPSLLRGRWLVVCEDLDCGQERKFYACSMQNVRLLDDEDCKTLPNRGYCVIDGPRVAYSASTCPEALAYQLGFGRGVVCAVMVREPEVQ